MDTRAWAVATAISAARSLDECAKAFLRAGDVQSAQHCRTAAKADEKAREALETGIEDES